jgi:hypothetical protein
MRRSYQKICALLAAADFDEREIWEFVEAVHKAGPSEVARYVIHIRHMLMSEMKNGGSDWYIRKRPSNFEPSSETEEKIAHLLLEDAGLPKYVAITRLTQELKKRHPSEPIPSESRKGFTSWIRKLLAITSESELLHVATRIRNEFVHERPSDWHLK